MTRREYSSQTYLSNADAILCGIMHRGSGTIRVCAHTHIKDFQPLSGRIPINKHEQFFEEVLCSGALGVSILAIPMAWYKCQNSHNVQKCLRRVPKVFSGLRAERPKRVSRAVPISHRGKQPKTGFRTVQQTILGLSARRPENTFSTLLKHFWTFWLF